MNWAFCEVEKEFMASTLHATGAIPLSETICPKKRSRFWPNKHLAALIICVVDAQILAEDGLGVLQWRTKILICHLYRQRQMTSLVIESSQSVGMFGQR